MSDIAQTRIFTDGLRTREAAAGAIAGALHDLEAVAAKKGHRVIWDTIGFESEEQRIDSSSLAHHSFERVRSLRIAARTVDPAEVGRA